MTTIAWDGKVLASDSRWCDNDVQTISRTKIRRLPSGALYGGAGSSDDRELVALVAKAKKFEQLPTLAQLGAIRQSLRSILILPNRRVYIIDTCKTAPGDAEAEECGVTEYGAPCAVGTGAGLALAAMMAQARHGKPNAFEAVRIACDLDPQSKAPVYRLTLHPKNNKPKPLSE